MCITSLRIPHASALIDTLMLSRRARYAISALSISHNIYEIIKITVVEDVTRRALFIYFSFLLSASLPWKRDIVHCNARKRSLRSKTGFHAALDIYPDRGDTRGDVNFVDRISFTSFASLSHDFLARVRAPRNNVSMYCRQKTAVFASYTLSRPNDPFDIH